MVAVASLRMPEDLARRLDRAIRESGRSATAIGASAGLPPGYIHKVLGTTAAKRIDSPGPEKLRALADELGVSYEWLATGHGEMRGGRAGGGPRDEALAFARNVMHAREAAVAAALEKHGQEADALTAFEWLVAIDLEERRLDRADIAQLSREREALLRRMAEAERHARPPVPRAPKSRA